ncbi:histidine utilization repressor [Marinobacter sp. X15-166B]|uniref:histidine utilization repressor n=1 Tax=Marinobacter sp. X15-166B TaxID=1897620 RepID=UPI00085C5253|nr:histidine utilization repressor [Marinobacter sp. X15-166B]OEY65367.1 histidine utilization repressor [Marinobacter sp. X15-166B]
MGRTPPLYLQIQQHLLDKIQSGEWLPEHQIPPEERLARDFGVSRMTANKAIRDLVQQGYLVRQAGIGTFVTDRKAESSLVEVHNIADEIRGRGHEHDCVVVIAAPCDADDEVSMRLGVRLDTRVFRTLILHRENGVPIQLEDRYVNPRHVPHYLHTDFHTQTPNEVLVSACPITDVEHVVEAVLVDRALATLLEITTQDPCLQLIRRTWSGDQLVSYARLTHPGTRYKLRSALQTAG